MKHCIECGAKVHNRSKRCVPCANKHKALENEAKCDRRLKVNRNTKTIIMPNGVEVLNNVFGKEIGILC